MYDLNIIHKRKIFQQNFIHLFDKRNTEIYIRKYNIHSIIIALVSTEKQSPLYQQSVLIDQKTYHETTVI